ncbi:MAG: hypothetical protein M1812_003699 [Candelaria pacifica]|nr:MAG: hypothetical protein M1812_003699 [Candelaria pacifica]
MSTTGSEAALGYNNEPSIDPLEWTDEELLDIGALDVPLDVALHTFRDLESVAIMPVFGCKTFPEISDANYDAFKPILQLASMFFSEPNGLGYWLDLALAERIYISGEGK